MPECLPDSPRYIRQTPEGFWIGADHQNGPWRPIQAPQSGLPWKTDEPAVPASREPASVAAEARPLSPADRLALAVCSYRPALCNEPCLLCRAQSAAVSVELAKILRERHGGSSQVADWLDGVGTHH